MRANNTRGRQVGVWGSVVVVLVGVGALLMYLSRPGANASMGEPAAEFGTVGTDLSGGKDPAVPAAFDRSETGAASAAIAYATAPQRWLYLPDDQIAVEVGEIATPSAAPRLIDDVIHDVSAAREQLGSSSGRVWWLVRPLAWRVDAFEPGHAAVAVWTVTVLSAEGVAAPQSEWVTVTLELIWLDGHWRVDNVRDTPGPTPLTGPGDQPWDAIPFDEALAGFSRMDGEALS